MNNNLIKRLITLIALFHLAACGTTNVAQQNAEINQWLVNNQGFLQNDNMQNKNHIVLTYSQLQRHLTYQQQLELAHILEESVEDMVIEIGPSDHPSFIEQIKIVEARKKVLQSLLKDVQLQKQFKYSPQAELNQVIIEWRKNDV